LPIGRPKKRVLKVNTPSAYQNGERKMVAVPLISPLISKMENEKWWLSPLFPVGPPENYWYYEILKSGHSAWEILY
jgi:hypothetical protein